MLFEDNDSDYEDKQILNIKSDKLSDSDSGLTDTCDNSELDTVSVVSEVLEATVENDRY